MNYKSYIIGIAALTGFASCSDDVSMAPLEADMKCDRTEISAGETVYFMDKSSGNPARWDWEFEGGEPATSQLSSPEIVYTTPGVYSVKLRVGRGDNNSEKVYTEYITVAYPDEIIADFEADKLNAYNTDDVTFTDLSTGFPAAWDWTFTNAEGITVKSTEQNPVLKFAPGVYTVTLTVTSPVANATITKENYLNVIDHDAVAAEFRSTTSRMILAGQTVTFEDMTMGRPENWNWTFEGADTRTSTERNPVVRYSTAGRYKVTMTAYNEVNSSTIEKDEYIMVLPTTGLSMWFPFNGSLKDMGPTGNTIMEEYTSDASKWKINLLSPSRHDGDYSVQLGGNCKTNSDDYAVLRLTNPEQLPGGMQSTTLVIWVKGDPAKGSRQGLFNRGRPAGAITGSTADKNQSQEWARLNTTASKSEGFARWYINSTGQGSACAANTTATSLLDNEWHCLVFVREVESGKCTAKIYADGKLEATSTPQTAKDTYKDPWFFGCTEQFTATKDHQINTPFQGCFDDIMLYDHAFTASEVQQLYNIMK